MDLLDYKSEININYRNEVFKMNKELWRFIDSGNCSPSFNMALDEALLDWHSEGKIPPVIRFYGWNPATLSDWVFSKGGKRN